MTASRKRPRSRGARRSPSRRRPRWRSSSRGWTRPSSRPASGRAWALVRLARAGGGRRTLGADCSSAVRTHWSPILVGLGTPGLALAVELAQAALSTSDPGAVHSPPAGADASPPQASALRFRPDRDPTVAEVSPRNVIAIAIGLSAAAWAHVHLVQPRSLRRRDQLRVTGQPRRRGSGAGATGSSVPE